MLMVSRWDGDGLGEPRRLCRPVRRRAAFEEIFDIQFGDWVNK